MKLNKLIALLLAVAMLFAFVGCPSGNEPDKPDNTGSQTQGGSDSIRTWTEGSSATEYKVYDVQDLQFLAEIVKAGNALEDITIIQAADIEFNKDLLGEGYTAPEEASAGVPNENFVVFEGIGGGKEGAGTPFSGTYDGQGHSISGAYIYGSQQGLGFFGYISDATITNVVLIDSCVVDSCIDENSKNKFGGLVGVAEGESTIENCVYVGAVGSEVAKARGGWIDKIGGILGYSAESSVTIANCFAHVNIVAGGFGGLVGEGSATVTDSYAVMGNVCYTQGGSSAVTFDTDVKNAALAVIDSTFGTAGAKLASLFQSIFVKGKIKFAKVDINGTGEGFVDKEIEKSALGDYTITVTFDGKLGYPAISLDVGFSYPGAITVAEGEGTPAAVDTVFVNGSYAIQLDASYADVTKVFTFSQEDHTDTVITLIIKEPEEIPEDSIRTYAGDNETRKEFSVYNYKDLKKLAALVAGGNGLDEVTITQKADIAINDSVLADGSWDAPAESSAGKPNANLEVFEGIGKKDKFFRGTYDGKGYIISGLYIYTDHSHTGFFAGTTSATLKNIIIKDACVVADGTTGDSDDRIGGLVGTARDTKVSNCVFIGTVGSKAACDGAGNYEYVGGLIGRCEKTVSTATNCVVVAQIFAESNSNESKPVCGKHDAYLTKDDTVKGYEPAAYEAAKDTVDAEIAAVIAAAKGVQ